MSVLTVENLNFGYDDKVLLKDISFRLLNGEHVGLVGANGTGKTTLFNILTHRIVPDSGNLYYPSSVNIGYLDQHWELKEGISIREVLKSAFNDLYQIENQMLKIGDKLAGVKEDETEKLLKEFGRLQDLLYAEDFYSIDKKVDLIASGLGLDALGMDTFVDKLSGGQRMKVKLGWLLLGSPHLLLLDEPTNYLDKEHIDWLSDYLNNYPHSFLVVSHDTSFLNRITNVIYHIEFSILKRYLGNYNDFLKLKDEARKKYINEYNRQKKEIARLEDFISKNIARASTTKQAQSRRKQLNKIERLDKPKILPTPSFSFLTTRPSSTLIFRSNDMAIGYSYSLLKNLNLELKKGSKIAITGCNGIGKSTLLKTIMGVIPPLNGSVEQGDYLYPVYFEQESKVGSRTALEEVWSEFPKKTQKEVRQALAQCGLKQDHIFQRVNELSGGEQSKVRLCKLMMTPSNWLLLDEPTNHLDSMAKTELKEALIKYDGTILLVCHEKEFYEDWVTEVWNMEKYI